MKEVFIVNKPELYSFIESTLIDTFLQLARVNIITGEYQYLKQDPDIKKDFEGVTNIYDYMRKFASEKYVYPEFVDEYMKFSDPEYVQKKVFGGERTIVYRYKRKTPNGI